MTLLLAVFFLAGNAFFVGAQFALITARPDQIRPLADAGQRAARTTLGLQRQLPRMLAATQLGIAICSLGLGAVAEPAFAHLLEAGFETTGLPSGLLHPAAFMIALAIVSYCHMVLGEMVPKNLALAGPVRAALWLGPPMAVWAKLTRPLVAGINATANAILRLFRIEPTEELESSYTAEEIADLITESAAEGMLDPDERQRLHQALAMDRVTAGDLLLPMDTLVTITPQTTARELEQLVATTGHSRYPVREGTDLIGYLHGKDILDLTPEAFDLPLPARLCRPMVTIPAEQSLTDTFLALQQTGTHLGRVADSGNPLGVITLEDVLGQLVGNFQGPSGPERGVESLDNGANQTGVER
jgi:CBS domain containing-hemolysin-like protein